MTGKPEIIRLGRKLVLWSTGLDSWGNQAFPLTTAPQGRTPLASRSATHAHVQRVLKLSAAQVASQREGWGVHFW